MALTEKEKQDLQQLLQMGQITQEQYDFYLADAENKPPVATPSPAPALTPPPRPSQASAPPPDIAEWLVEVNNAEQGPYNKAKLGEMLKAREITRQSIVWKERRRRVMPGTGNKMRREEFNHEPPRTGPDKSGPQLSAYCSLTGAGTCLRHSFTPFGCS